MFRSIGRVLATGVMAINQNWTIFASAGQRLEITGKSLLELGIRLVIAKDWNRIGIRQLVKIAHRANHEK